VHRERTPGKRTDITSRPDGGRSFSEQIAEHNISEKQARQWQQLADVPEDQFEAALTDADKPTTNGILSSAKQPDNEKVTPVSNNALWLWGRLRDFQRRRLLGKGPAEILNVAFEMHVQLTRTRSSAMLMCTAIRYSF
jgi:hypothetical protein